MNNLESSIYSVIGMGRVNIRPFVYAIQITSDLLFVHNIPVEEVRFTRDVYPQVALLTSKNCSTVTRQIERMCNRFWDSLTSEQRDEYIGCNLINNPYPCELLCYLAHYYHFSKAFFAD